MPDKFDSIINDLKNNVQPQITNQIQSNPAKNVQSLEGTRLITEGINVSNYTYTPEGKRFVTDSKDGNSKK